MQCQGRNSGRISVSFFSFAFARFLLPFYCAVYIFYFPWILLIFCSNEFSSTNCFQAPCSINRKLTVAIPAKRPKYSKNCTSVFKAPDPTLLSLSHVNIRRHGICHIHTEKLIFPHQKKGFKWSTAENGFQYTASKNRMGMTNTFITIWISCIIFSNPYLKDIAARSKSPPSQTNCQIHFFTRPDSLILFNTS